MFQGCLKNVPLTFFMGVSVSRMFQVFFEEVERVSKVFQAIFKVVSGNLQGCVKSV